MTSPVSRRTFLAGTTAAVAAAATPAVHAAGSDTLKVALIGCGGRGTGATLNALNADKAVKLVAVADVFADRAESALKTLKISRPEKCDVTPDRVFSGFDAYKSAIDCADVVILATPPGFRPTHLKYAVEAGKHTFMEKPHATDVPGARSVLESARLAKEKNLSLVSGFCYRYDPFKRDVVGRIHAGAIGDVQAIHATYLTGELWTRATKTKDPAEMEYQLRMWYYFTWLSGDFIIEQAIHSIDKAAWVMNGALPVSAVGLGGRQVRTDPKYGNIYDHFSVCYEYEGGQNVFLDCRQQNNTYSETNDTITGTKGTCQLMRHTITTAEGKYKPPGKHDFGLMYQVEHDELFAGIRAGKPLNDAEVSVKSTLMGLMGREAAYTGQKITWEKLMKSDEKLVPDDPQFGKHAVRPVAMPGVTKFA